MILDGSGAGTDPGADTFDPQRAENALRRCVAEVAIGLGVGAEGTSFELADRATMYLALDQRLRQFPGRDVAVVWDERRGWAVGVENRSGDDELVMVAWYGPDLLPAPEEVVRFVRRVLAGRVDHPAPPSVPREQFLGLRGRLARRPPS
jgi:hypothetical protein